MAYKRTKHDSPLKCPYCDRQFSMNRKRFLSYKYNRLNKTECKGCGKEFYYWNISAQFARTHNIRATYKVDEDSPDNIPVEINYSL